jgi:Protein of unknown function (DUF1592)/Protein of unknown function (DUF1588)/Protein of unknown function (DUF1587)/Protein of unknown function (DUF1595)/Protein of unknown function (DUF1585)
MRGRPVVLSLLCASIAPCATDVTAMRRLTHSQYNHTVHDLLGDQTNPANQFPQEDFVNGFKNQTSAQSVPPLLAEAYSAAAEKLARNAFRGGDVNHDVNHLVPCRPRAPGDSQCAAQFIRAFGAKAFRRPLTPTEVARYAALFADETRHTGKFLAGAQLIVEAMLQSPNFLFHAERGGDTRQYEIACRLSYFLWDTMPDADLFEAAARGELTTSASIEKQARRMIVDPRARQSVDEFAAEWLRFDRLLNAVKDRRRYPQYSPELVQAMTEETRRMVADAVWNDRDFMTIFSAGYSFLNSDLAALYGVATPTAEYARVDFPTDSDRAGIVGQATFLALTSKPNETSPTSRGVFVREQFLCQKVPDPPPGVNSNLPPVSEDKPQTNRERMAAHATQQPCAGCHQFIDPIGFGLEKYDAIGGRREKLELKFYNPHDDDDEKKVKTVLLDLDAHGGLSGVPGADFSSPKELGKILAARPECQECVVRQLFRYGWGRHELGVDRPVIQAALQRFRDSQFRFKELMISLVNAYALGN